MGEKVRKKRSKLDRSKDVMDVQVNDEKDLGHSIEVETKIKKKRVRKDKKNKCGTDEVSNLNELIGENHKGIVAEGQTFSNEGNATFMRNGEEENTESRRKRRKKGRGGNEIINSIVAGDKEMQVLDDNQERKKKKSKNCNDSISGVQDIDSLKFRNKSKGTEDAKFKSNKGGSSLARVKLADANAHSDVADNDYEGKNMKKEKLTNKSKRIDDSKLKSNGGDPDLSESSEGDPHLLKINLGDPSEHAIATDVDDQGNKKKTKKKKSNEDKRVTFSDQLEVFNDGLVRGKVFTPEEDEKIKEAVYSYIESHGLGDKGLEMVLHCNSHREIRNCWKEIGLALPHRPQRSVYRRAHNLFERDEKWTPEDYEFIQNFYENHGAKWRMMADILGKHPIHVRLAWRRMKLGNNRKFGRWSQEEIQKLYDLVNTDLCQRASEDHRKLRWGMLRDNICFEAVSDKLGTRPGPHCSTKWYQQLTSPMVAKGEWTDTDDYRLVDALFALDACCMEEVDWDNLFAHRSGEICRKRWNQMVHNVGEHRNMSFSEQVEILSKRYCPHLVKVREAFDNKPVVS